jgi:hypothetical protein
VTATPISANRATTWYKPEFVNDAAGHTCYCNRPAHGRTRYWDGHQYVYKYQCREHLPADAAVYQAVQR